MPNRSAHGCEFRGQWFMMEALSRMRLGMWCVLIRIRLGLICDTHSAQERLNVAGWGVR
jgi:hypothetical protein